MDQILTWIDYAGVVVFAATGCLVAARKRLDVISFILLATVTGIGGGTVRDVVLDLTPVFWVAEPIYLLLCTTTALLMFLVAQKINAYQRWLIWGDAVGIAVFTVIGTDIAMRTGAHWSVCLLMGVTTSIVGGIIRDLLAGEPSLVMRREIYATACAAGSGLFLLMHAFYPSLAVAAGVFVTFAIRAAAIYWRLHLPGYAWQEDDAKRRSGDH